MCYMNCIYENHSGECSNPKMMGTPMAKCCIDEEEYDFNEDEYNKETDARDELIDRRFE